MRKAFVTEGVIRLPIRNANVRTHGTKPVEKVRPERPHHAERAPQAKLVELLTAYAVESLPHKAQIAARDLGKLIQLLGIWRRLRHAVGIRLKKGDTELLFQGPDRLGKPLRRNGHHSRRRRIIALLIGQLKVL